jgi:hypothetical protein
MNEIEDIQLIGNEVAIRWKDGTENYYRMEKLRASIPLVPRRRASAISSETR